MKVYEANAITIPDGPVKRILDMRGTVLWRSPMYTPFYVEDVSGSDSVLTIKGSTPYQGATAPNIAVQVSIDGVNWTNIGTVSTSDITTTIPANSRLYLRADTTSWGGVSGYYTANHSIKANKKHKIGGNIMSLLYGANFTGNERSLRGACSFLGLFRQDTNLTNAKNLILPATSLTSHCYYDMFSGCTGMVGAPKILAIKAHEACCMGMFANCKALINAPNIYIESLEYSVASQRYYRKQVFYNMFSGCTSLIDTPELKISRLGDECYRQMFGGCTSLKIIKCYATNTSATNCLTSWVYGVPSSGTFYKKAGSTWSTGVSGIPAGWTVIEV